MLSCVHFTGLLRFMRLYNHDNSLFIIRHTHTDTLFDLKERCFVVVEMCVHTVIMRAQVNYVLLCTFSYVVWWTYWTYWLQPVISSGNNTFVCLSHGQPWRKNLQKLHRDKIKGLKMSCYTQTNVFSCLLQCEKNTPCQWSHAQGRHIKQGNWGNPLIL